MRSVKRAYGLILVLGLCVTKATAMTTPPKIQRACLDANGLVTVTFQPSADLCGSFSSYELWGRDNTLSPFTKLATGSTQAATQMQALITKKKWEFYIAALFACNGVDTLFSDTIFVDDSPPGVMEPDSVSIDLLTQKMVAGWQKAPEADVMGYSLFKTDPSNGKNTLIDEKNVLYYSFSTSDFDPLKSGNRFSLAVYDSCTNGGVISNYHSPMLLSFLSGQNVDYQCTKKLYIQWTNYVGWSVSGFDIYVIDSSTSTWSLAASVGNSVFNYTFDIPALGRTYGFLIRAHKSGSPITSSSNLISFRVQDFVLPSYKGIGHVSVVADGVIEITGAWEATGSLKQAQLQYRNYGGSTWTTLTTYAGTKGTFRYRHTNRNTSAAKYEYRIVFTNTCDSPVDSSGSHISLLLKRNLFLFYWNGYWGWSSSSHLLDLQEKEKQSSTWNELGIAPDSQYIVEDTMIPNCYRVVALRYGINNKPIDTAYSNVICLKAIDTTLVPGAFTPGGQNPIFKIYNPNLLPGQSVLKIYNRWGQKMFEGDALVGWDGKDQHGDFLMSGIYIYLVEVRTIEKIETFEGTLMLMR